MASAVEYDLPCINLSDTYEKSSSIDQFYIEKIKKILDESNSNTDYKAKSLPSIKKLISHSLFEYSIGIDQLKSWKEIQDEIARLDSIQSLLRMSNFLKDIDLQNSTLHDIREKIKFLNAMKRLQSHREFTGNIDFATGDEILTEIQRLNWISKLKVHQEFIGNINFTTCSQISDEIIRLDSLHKLKSHQVFQEFRGNLDVLHTNDLVLNEISRLDYIYTLKFHPMIQFNKLATHPENIQYELFTSTVLLNEGVRLDFLQEVYDTFPDKVNLVKDLNSHDMISNLLDVFILFDKLIHHEFYQNNIELLCQQNPETINIDLLDQIELETDNHKFVDKLWNTDHMLRGELYYLDSLSRLIVHPLYRNNIELFNTSNEDFDALTEEIELLNSILKEMGGKPQVIPDPIILDPANSVECIVCYEHVTSIHTCIQCKKYTCSTCIQSIQEANDIIKCPMCRHMF